MKKRLGIIFIAVSLLPPMSSADVNNRYMAPAVNLNDNRAMHPAYPRHQAYQQHFYNRQRPAMQRPMPPAYIQEMQEQHKKRMAAQRERMQQMRSQRQNYSARECGPQNQARNHSRRPDRPMRSNDYRGYRRPQPPAIFQNRMNVPQRSANQASAYSAYRGYPARSPRNQYQAQVNNQQAQQRFYQRNYRQAPPMMPSSAYMAPPYRGQSAQYAGNFYPNPAQRYHNGYRFGNIDSQKRVPPVAYRTDAQRYQARPQVWRAMPAPYPYQMMRANKAAYAR